jgi:hypothetical protein
MARNFNKFTYINNDTLSLMSNLQHNISDLEGRASFSVAAFVPVYDHRLDAISESPFINKFGTMDAAGFANKYPQMFRNNDSSSPFPILSKKLDGILCDDDIYLWKNTATKTGTPPDYVLSNEGRTIDPTYSKSVISVAYMECTSGPRIGDMYILPHTESIIIDSVPKGVALGSLPIDIAPGIHPVWNSADSYYDTLATPNMWQFWKTDINSDNAILDCVPDNANKPNNMIDRKTLVSFPNTPVYKLSTNGSAVNFSQEKEDVDYTTLVPAKYSSIGEASNISIPVYKASLSGDLVWEKHIEGTKATQTPIYSKSKDVDLNQLSLNNFDAFTGVRYFAKSAQDADGHEKTIANYRIEFSDQIGTVRFNKIVTYVRLYRKNKAGHWGWGDRLYPFSVTLLPEPVVKSNTGIDGVDVFELDIEIDYDQYAEYSMPDFKAITNIPTFIPITNTLRTNDNNIIGAIESDKNTNKYIGAQTDKRIFATSDVDPLGDAEASYKWTLTNPTHGKWLKRNNINTNYGRVNTDNVNLVYTDIDFSVLDYMPALPLEITVGPAQTEVIDISLDTHIEFSEESSQEFSVYDEYSTSPSLVIGSIDAIVLSDLQTTFNGQKYDIVQYYLSIRKVCENNPYDTKILGGTGELGDPYTIDAEPDSEESLLFYEMMASILDINTNKPIQLA